MLAGSQVLLVNLLALGGVGPVGFRLSERGSQQKHKTTHTESN